MIVHRMAKKCGGAATISAWQRRSSSFQDFQLKHNPLNPLKVLATGPKVPQVGVIRPMINLWRKKCKTSSIDISMSDTLYQTTITWTFEHDTTSKLQTWVISQDFAQVMIQLATLSNNGGDWKALWHYEVIFEQNESSIDPEIILKGLSGSHKIHKRTDDLQFGSIA